MREPFATSASMSDEPATPRNGPEAESEDPQLVANRGANSITARLRRAIETGVYSAGDQLPPERQLAVAFGTARSTIRKALDQLELKGFVLRRVGSGTFVRRVLPDHLLEVRRRRATSGGAALTSTCVAEGSSPESSAGCSHPRGGFSRLGGGSPVRRARRRPTATKPTRRVAPSRMAPTTNHRVVASTGSS